MFNGQEVNTNFGICLPRRNNRTNKNFFVVCTKRTIQNRHPMFPEKRIKDWILVLVILFCCLMIFFVVFYSF